MNARALAAVALTAGLLAPRTALASGYSTALDRLWTFADPAASEARFRAEVARWPADSAQALEATTQLARSIGLQRRYAEAHATLDRVEAEAAASTARVRARLALERGRVFNSAGDPARAVPQFERAAMLARTDTAAGSDYYLVDALHMLALASPAPDRARWARLALDTAEASADPRARDWRASLLHNMGWEAFDAGDAPAALALWQRALAAREPMGDASRTRIAKWTVARGLRAVGRLDEAQALQLVLVAEFDAAGATDGYVYEELAEIAIARGDAAAARPWAARAVATLGADAGFRSSQPARLARLEQLARPQEPAP